METCDILVNYKKDGALGYRFVNYDQRLSLPAGETSPLALERTKNFVSKAYFPAIRDVGKESFLVNGELYSALANLKGLGNQIYREFVPTDLCDLVKNLPDGSTIRIVSDELGIPWELVYNGKGFWGQRFVISRVTTSYNVQPPPSRSYRFRKVLNIVGATLNSAVKEKALHLFDSIRENVTVIDIDGDSLRSTYDIYQHFQGSDVIHFTCHGELPDTGVYLQIVKEKRPTLNLMPAAVGMLPIEHGCIILANACVSSGFQTGINTMMSFGTEFCSNEKRGGAYVGTLDLVPDLPSLFFADQFYHHLFKGYTVGNSLRLAKNTNFNSDRGGIYGLFPLVYSLYGNPML